MNAGSLVDCIQNRVLGDALCLLFGTGFVHIFGMDRGVQLDLETVDNVVVELNNGVESVAGGPGLGEGKAVLAVGVFGLNICAHCTGGSSLVTNNLEDDTGGGGGLDLKSGMTDGVFLVEQVIGALSKILPKRKKK